MSSLSTQRIAEFQDICAKEHGVVLTMEEATEIAERFMSLARIALQPMPKTMLERYKELLPQNTVNVNLPTSAY